MMTEQTSIIISSVLLVIFVFIGFYLVRSHKEITQYEIKEDQDGG